MRSSWRRFATHLSTRLIASFVILGAVTTLVGLFSLDRLAQVHASTQVLERDVLPSSMVLAEMDATLAKIRIAEIGHTISTSAAERATYARETTALLALLARHQAHFETLVDGADETKLYEDFSESWRRYLAAHAVVLEMSDRGNGSIARTTIRGSSQIDFDRAETSLARLISAEVRSGTAAIRRSEAQYFQARIFIAGCLAAALILGIGLAMRLLRSVTQPLSVLVSAAERIGAGDLAYRVGSQTSHEFEQLGRTFNGMAERLGAAQHALEQRVIELNAERDAHREARQLAESASKAKSEFLSNMSHELRTPLNSVIGFSDILLKNRAKTFATKELGYVDRIQANGRHLLALINSVLDLSKVEAGHIELEITSVALGDLVRETLAELEPQAAARRVRLIAALPDAPCVLETDRARLKQVLINLVGNAVKFTSDGEVSVILQVDPLSGRALRIDVADTGIGIPAERIDSVFEAFQQADGSTSRQYGGTGLGLTISRTLSQLLGFDIDVTSEVGVGSTFGIVLDRPGAEPQHQLTMVGADGALAQGAHAGHAEGDFLILVIDDESDARIILKRAFEDMGCSVITAAGVDEGVALARTLSPGMIALDLMMPRKNGWDALREFEDDPLLRDIPVVVVSAVASDNRGPSLATLDYLDKPVAREDLKRVVDRNRLRASRPTRSIA